MRNRTKSVWMIVILSAVGLAIFLSKLGEPPILTTNEDPSQIRVEESDDLPSEEVTPVTERTVVPTSNSVFADVEDSQLDNQIIDAFLSARPIGSYRIVSVDADYLRTIIREPEESGDFLVQLMDDTPLKLVARNARESSTGWDSGFGTWIGTIDGDEMSRASFVVGPDSSVNGVIRTIETGRIKIERIKGTPYHLIWTLDPNFSQKID